MADYFRTGSAEEEGRKRERERRKRWNVAERGERSRWRGYRSHESAHWFTPLSKRISWWDESSSWHKLPCIRCDVASQKTCTFSSSFPLAFSSWKCGTRQLLPWKLFSPISISSFELSFERNNRYFFFLLTVLSSSTQLSLSRHVCLDCRHFSRYTIRVLRILVVVASLLFHCPR